MLLWFLVVWTALLGTSLGDTLVPYPTPGVGATPVGQYVHQFSTYDEPSGFGVQTGYEGFLVPESPPDPEKEGGFFSLLRQIAEYLGILDPVDESAAAVMSEGHSAISARPLLLLRLLPKLLLALKLLLKVGIWLFAPLSLLLLGGALTASVCVFTPLCTLSFLGFGFSRENVRNLISQDRLTAISNFVSDAIQKYRKMQKGSYKEEMRRLAAMKTKPDTEKNKIDSEAQKKSKAKTQ
ncbi:uncharacterized protein [Periplaneta americana]|uniref:uncharacterized protein n=1 Tax=Periplaneta americana TaxID=6978 RepID=UPI0037E9ADDF